MQSVSRDGVGRWVRERLSTALLTVVLNSLGLGAFSLCVIALGLHEARAQADAYPNKPIRFIVSFPAGSATDQGARLIAQAMTKATGQSVIVDNRGGASGFIACEAVARSAPDGYTVLITTGTTHSANPSLYKKLPYDPVKDFLPVTPFSHNAFVLVVASGFAANTVTDLVKITKAEPSKYSFSSANAPSRIGGEMFKMMAGVDLLHVPYKGAPQALTDLIAGQVSMMWTDLRTGMPLVQGGKLKALAVTGKKRLAVTPTMPTMPPIPPIPPIPTMIEQGFPDYELANWGGVYLPAGTSREIVLRLNTLVHAAVKAEQAAHESMGGEVLLLSPEGFAELQARDTTMWARVTKAAGMIPE